MNWIERLAPEMIKNDMLACFGHGRSLAAPGCCLFTNSCSLNVMFTP